MASILRKVVALNIHSRFLVGVEGEIAKWAGYNVILSLLAQQKISKAIVQYHVEIDWFCDRYMVGLSCIHISQGINY